MTINELIKVAHADAKAKGWWDEERNLGEALMLIVSECGEALEAHRSNKRADVEPFLMEYEAADEEWDAGIVTAFRAYIKDTFEDELADIVIRIADYAGSLGKELGDWGPPTPRSMEFFEPKNVGELLLICTKAVCRLSDSEQLPYEPIRHSIGIVFLIALLHNIDLWCHIELKLTYNRTRSYRHGKAY